MCLFFIPLPELMVILFILLLLFAAKDIEKAIKELLLGKPF